MKAVRMPGSDEVFAAIVNIVLIISIFQMTHLKHREVSDLSNVTQSVGF